MIDRWSLAEWLAYDDYGMRKVKAKADLLDHDVYPILRRYLQGPRIGRARVISASELDRMLDSLGGRVDFPSESRVEGGTDTSGRTSEARVRGEAPAAFAGGGALKPL